MVQAGRSVPTKGNIDTVCFLFASALLFRGVKLSVMLSADPRKQIKSLAASFRARSEFLVFVAPVLETGLLRHEFHTLLGPNLLTLGIHATDIYLPLLLGMLVLFGINQRGQTLNFLSLADIAHDSNTLMVFEVGKFKASYLSVSHSGSEYVKQDSFVKGRCLLDHNFKEVLHLAIRKCFGFAHDYPFWSDAEFGRVFINQFSS